MQNQKFLRLALAGIVLSLIGSLALPLKGMGLLSSSQNRPAAAAQDLASTALYLPVMMNHFPFQTVFGIESHDISPSGGLDLITQAKTTWVRRNALLWSDIEPTEGTFNWSAAAGLEQEMINASRSGLNLILVVRSTPTWAQKLPNSFCGPIKSDKMPAFGDFMYQAVKRYSVAPYNVRFWQVWNEPDADPYYVTNDSVYGCWGDVSDFYYGGEYYADALQAVYPRIKQADPAAQVLIGGLLLGCTSCTQANFLEGILRHHGYFDGKNYFDGVAFHAYDDYVSLGQYSDWGWSTSWNTTGPVLSAKAHFIKSVLSNYNASKKYLMNTEAALRYCNGLPPSEVNNFNATKAYYIAQLYAVSIVENLEATIWYDLSGGWCNTGMMGPGLSLTPAYQAFTTSRKALQNASFTREITDYAGVKGYEFNRGDRRVWILWSLDGNDHLNTPLPGAPLLAYDALNNPVAINGLNVTVTLTPIYLEWNP